MTSTTPPTSPEAQAQAIPTPAPGSTGPGGRPWLEPAVLVAVLGLAVTILALLLSIAFGIYSMNTRIDALDTSFNARIDALGANLNARINTLGGDLNARIEQVYQLLLPRAQVTAWRQSPAIHGAAGRDPNAASGSPAALIIDATYVEA